MKTRPRWMLLDNAHRRAARLARIWRSEFGAEHPKTRRLLALARRLHSLYLEACWGQ